MTSTQTLSPRWIAHHLRRKFYDHSDLSLFLRHDCHVRDWKLGWYKSLIPTSGFCISGRQDDIHDCHNSNIENTPLKGMKRCSSDYSGEQSYHSSPFNAARVNIHHSWRKIGTPRYYSRLKAGLLRLLTFCSKWLTNILDQRDICTSYLYAEHSRWDSDVQLPNQFTATIDFGHVAKQFISLSSLR